MGFRGTFGAVAAGLAAASLVAGCGGGDKAKDKPTGAPSSSPAAVKTITQAEARTVLKRYEQTNNKANAKVSDALLRANETGPMLEVDLAGNKRIRAKQDKKIKAFHYSDAKFYIPDNVNGAWFVASAKSSSGKQREFLTFVNSGNGAYRATMGIWLEKGTKLPAFAQGTGGGLTAVTAGPALEVGAKYAAYMTAISKGKHAPAGIKAGPQSSKLAKSWERSVKRIKAGHRWTGGEKWKARAQPVYALKTADGGALVVGAADHTETYTSVRPNVWYRPDSAFFGLGPKRYYHSFTGVRVWATLSHVPAKGAADILGADAGTVTANGS